MSCSRPRRAWRASWDGETVVFQKHLGRPGTEFELPCGKCLLCRKKYVNDWVIRLIHEAKMHDSTCCVTLTYEDRYLPPNGELCLKDMQSFLGKLRKYIKKEFGKRIRYFYCAEYGSDNGRPHYHLIIFGFDFSHDRRPINGRDNPNPKFRSESLTKLWGKGLTDIGQVNGSTCRYVMKYCLKSDQQNAKRDPHIIRPYAAPARRVETLPFHRQSTNPGIGHGYYKDNSENMYIRDKAGVRNQNGGVTYYSIPRYYNRKLGEDEPDSLEWMQEQRALAALEHPVPIERLLAREEILRLQLAKGERGEKS